MLHILYYWWRFCIDFHYYIIFIWRNGILMGMRCHSRHLFYIAGRGAWLLIFRSRVDDRYFAFFFLFIAFTVRWLYFAHLLMGMMMIFALSRRLPTSRFRLSGFSTLPHHLIVIGKDALLFLLALLFTFWPRSFLFYVELFYTISESIVYYFPAFLSSSQGMLSGDTPAYYILFSCTVITSCRAA